MADVKIKRLFVDAVAEIIDPTTGRVTGMVYRWNTGEYRKRWIGERLKIFKLRPLDNVQTEGRRQ